MDGLNIIGIPQDPGQFSFTIGVTDADGDYNEEPLEILIDPQQSIKTSGFVAEADTYVASDQPNTNFGGSTSLGLLGALPTAHEMYLRFNVSGIPAGGAVLRGLLAPGLRRAGGRWQ